MRSRRRGGIWLRLGVSGLFMAWVIRKVDWREFGRTIGHVDPTFLGLSIALMPLIVAVSAWKTRVLMMARGHAISLPACIRLYLIGMFFNNFLPTNVGGDVVRGYMLGQRTGEMAEAMACVFVERLTGLMTLAWMVVVAAFFAPDEVTDARIRGSVLLFLGLCAVLFWLIFDRRFRRFTAARQRIKLVAKIGRFQDAVQTFHGHRGAMGWCLALSVAFYLLAALNIYWSARAFRAALSYPQGFLVTPIVAVVSMFPSVGGIGVAEWAYVYGLGRFGLAPTVALSTAFLIRVKVVVLSLIGGWSYAVRGQRVALADAGGGARTPGTASPRHGQEDLARRGDPC